MDEDDVMPNSGEYFMPREPQDQVISRKKEKAQTLQDIKLLEELIARWQNRIEFYSSVKSIPEEVKLDPEKFMYTVAGNAVIVEILETEKAYMEDLISRYAPSR